MNINWNRTLRNKTIQTSEIQAIYAISLQNIPQLLCTVSTARGKALSAALRWPLFNWVKSLGQVPRITPSIYNTLNWMHWLNAKIWLTYVKVSPPYKCNWSSPWLAPWTLMCVTPSLQATRLCIIVNLTSLLLRYSKGRRDGIRMYVPCMTHGKFGTLLLPILFFP